MSAVPVIRILPIGFLANLLLFSLISPSVCVEFTEETGKLGKINVLQRAGNQWAIGHFMGKKSLQDTYRLREQDMEGAAIFPPRSMESMRATLLQEQRRALSPSQMQGAQRILKKILEQYFNMSRK
ncbi:PREDICTED: bombesin-like [Nanorana parkeri]|uniref:bombesin-like n=1 Tax=Nanorana parkeri TaxID=125878 RepID=UPI0008542B2A|nr:PREDICTED: bombesin-like [Nanorana parkeri]